MMAGGVAKHVETRRAFSLAFGSTCRSGSCGHRAGGWGAAPKPMDRVPR